MEHTEFKKLDYEELKELMAWAQQEGWNPGVDDASLFWNADSEGFYGLFLNSEMVGGGALVSFEGKYGSMGLFIVKPSFRGHGLGKNLWFKRRNTLLSRLSEGAAIGMDGVLSMQPFYARGGFEIAFRDMRYECEGRKFEMDECIREAQSSDDRPILEYDYACMGFKRERFLSSWIHQEHGKTFVYQSADKPEGFAVIRQAINGMKIGPLFAEHETAAEALFKACLNHAAGQSAYIDIPLSHDKAVALVNKYAGNAVFECARMYYGTPPPLDLSRLYGIATLELG